jgi:hypothetical protein
MSRTELPIGVQLGLGVAIDRSRPIRQGVLKCRLIEGSTDGRFARCTVRRSLGLGLTRESADVLGLS